MVNAKGFVALFKAEKENQLKLYLSETNDSVVSDLLGEMNLSREQSGKMKRIIDTVLIDTYTSILCGLDGSASIGGVQQAYTVVPEGGNPIESCGDIEAEAYNQFHTKQG